MTDALVDRLFPAPETEPAGRWVISGDDLSWVADEEVADG